MVQDETDKDLFKKFKAENPLVSIEFRTFRKIKPFYVRICKPADLQTCCCKTHMNFRNAFEALIDSCQQYNIAYMRVHPDNTITVMAYLYKDCIRNSYGLLIDDYESGKCEKVIKDYVNNAKLGVPKAFVRFEYINVGRARKLDLVQSALH